MRWGRVAAGAVVLAAAVVAALLLHRHGIPDIRRAVGMAGVWAPMIFVLLHGTVTVAPVPRTVFTVAAGVLFGWPTGLLVALAGTSLSAVTAFLLVRTVGGALVERHAHRRAVSWVRTRIDHSGLLAMISLRLIPAMPFAVMNYASALSGVRLWQYLLGTVLGVLPGTITIVVLGDAAVGGNPPLAMLMVSVVSGLVGVGGALVAALRRLPAGQGREPIGTLPDPGTSAG